MQKIDIIFDEFGLTSNCMASHFVSIVQAQFFGPSVDVTISEPPTVGFLRHNLVLINLIKNI